MPALAAISAKALPPLPQPTKATCLGKSRSASFGFLANTGSIMLVSSFDSFPSRLLNLGSMGIHNLDFHRSTLQPLASEVVGIDIDCPVSSLHHPADELIGSLSLICPC